MTNPDSSVIPTWDSVEANTCPACGAIGCTPDTCPGEAEFLRRETESTDRETWNWR